MQLNAPSYFDQAAATWDENPVRRIFVEAVVEAILRRVQIASEWDMLDYGCGTGLVSFLLARHVGTVTAADSSVGMLDRLRKKIADSGLQTIRAVALDLERDPLPDDRYDLIVVNMGHDPEAATVYHYGFDRQQFRGMMERVGFHDVQDTTAHTIRKPVANIGDRDFPAFRMTGKR